jgi:trans-2,3-dihydro-3-hydroxyanthranilate isomerase
MEETLWVFGTEQSPGNPANVRWIDGVPPDDHALQAIARDKGLPVCCFVASSEGECRVRFFTSQRELPFCGHGALAAGAAMIMRNGGAEARFSVGQRVVQVERQQELFVLRSEGASLRDSVPVPEELRVALGLSSDQVRSCKLASIGSPKALVELDTTETLAAVSPDPARLVAWSLQHAVNGAYLYFRQGPTSALARAFNPLSGALEDAATGVAVGALAWALEVQFGSWLCVTQLPHGEPACQLHARRVEPLSTEVGGRVRAAPP